MLTELLKWTNEVANESVALAFASQALKATALIAAAALVSLAMRRRRAAERHLVWAFTMIGLIAIPVLGVVLPAWNVQAEVAVLATQVTHPQTGFVTEPPPQVDALPSAIPARAAFLGATERAAGPAAPKAVNFGAWILLAWLTGAAFVAVRYMVSSVNFLRMARGADPIAFGDLPTSVRALFAAARRRIAIRLTHKGAMPMTWGWLRPAILLPSEFRGWALERREIVLLHEYAHVSRRDAMTQAIAQAACALFWFHPLVWLAAGRLRFEAEQAADDFVLESGALPSDYAGHLVDVARQLRDRGAWGAVAMARPSSLGRRVRRLVAKRRPTVSPARLATAIAVLAVAAVAVPLAALRVHAQEREPQITPRDTQVERPVRSGEQVVAPVAPRVDAQPTPEPAPVPETSEPVVIAQAEPAPQPQLAPRPPNRTRRSGRKRQSSLPQETVDAIATALTEALSSPDAEVRAAAAESLGRIEPLPPAAVSALVAALDDSDPYVQEEAISAVSRAARNGQLESAQVSPAMIRLLRHEDADVRAEAAEALGRLGSADGAIVESLTGALDDQDEDVREEAMESLGRIAATEGIEPSRAVDMLRPGLTASHVGVRRRAVEALGRLDGAAAEAASLLIEASKDSDPGVQREAVEALGHLGDQASDWVWEFKHEVRAGVQGDVGFEF